MLGMGRKKPQANHDNGQMDDRPGLDSAQLAELMQCFPIGCKIRYFPDDQEDLALDSILIAYGINDHLVYTQNDIRSHMDGREHVFLLDDNWRDLVVRKVTSFCFLIPHIIDDDNDLSYPRKVELLNETRFARGRKMTLISLRNERGVPHVITQVRKRLVMEDGYYCNHPVVVLEAQPETLNLIDQRQERRLHAAIPSQLTVRGGDEGCPCVLVDFSETFVRVRGDRDGTMFQLLYEGQTLTLTIEPERLSRKIVVEGKVMRRDDDYLVMELLAIENNGEMGPFTMMDIFEFKATLLQHPETR